jgi:hypothetical protein
VIQQEGRPDEPKIFGREQTDKQTAQLWNDQQMDCGYDEEQNPFYHQDTGRDQELTHLVLTLRFVR